MILRAVDVVDGFLDVLLRGFVVHVMAATVVAGCLLGGFPWLLYL